MRATAEDLRPGDGGKDRTGRCAHRARSALRRRDDRSRDRSAPRRDAPPRRQPDDLRRAGAARADLDGLPHPGPHPRPRHRNAGVLRCAEPTGHSGRSRPSRQEHPRRRAGAADLRMHRCGLRHPRASRIARADLRADAARRRRHQRPGLRHRQQRRRRRHAASRGRLDHLRAAVGVRRRRGGLAAAARGCASRPGRVRHRRAPVRRRHDRRRARSRPRRDGRPLHPGRRLPRVRGVRRAPQGHGRTAEPPPHRRRHRRGSRAAVRDGVAVGGLGHRERCAELRPAAVLHRRPQPQHGVGCGGCGERRRQRPRTGCAGVRRRLQPALHQPRHRRAVRAHRRRLPRRSARPARQHRASRSSSSTASPRRRRPTTGSNC